MVGFRAVDVAVGLAGGLFKVDGVVLFVDVAVGLLAFVEAAVGLFSVDGLVVGVVLGLEEVVSGFLTVLEILGRSELGPGSSPNPLCGLEDGRSILR